MPGVLTGSRSAAPGWIGVLMPSVDQSGRYFPLTLVQPLPRMPVDSAQIGRLLDWLQRLDDLAVTALEQDWTLDQMEARLQDLGALPDFEPGQLDPHLTQPTAPQTEGLHADLAAVLRADKVAPARQLRHAQALWWFADEHGEEHLRVTTGLPRADDFSALLSSP